MSPESTTPGRASEEIWFGVADVRLQARKVSSVKSAQEVRSRPAPSTSTSIIRAPLSDCTLSSCLCSTSTPTQLSILTPDQLLPLSNFSTIFQSGTCAPRPFVASVSYGLLGSTRVCSRLSALKLETPPPRYPLHNWASHSQPSNLTLEVACSLSTRTLT